MDNSSRTLMVGGHDGGFLIIDRSGLDYLVGVRSQAGEVLSVYLMDVDIEKIKVFLSKER
jgi:hypothetical protein